MNRMQTATSLNTTLIDWLARMSAGRGAALVRGAQRFTALLSPLNPLETERPALHPDLALSLRIDSGLHQGASLELLQADYVIGSAEDCDIVLRDPNVAARHCRLTREWSGFTVRDLRPAAPRTAAPARRRCPRAP